MPENRSSYLDIEDTSVRKARKRYKRMYHRVMSGLERGENVRLLTLTSSPESGNFQNDFRKLIKRLNRRGLITSYIRVPELCKSGLRHDHIIIRGSYIEQQYLSYLWKSLHHAEVVDIRKVSKKPGLASYLANYISKNPASRYSYSWGWVWKGFVHSWKGLKGFSKEMGWPFIRLLTTWRWCVRMNIKPEEVIPI